MNGISQSHFHQPSISIPGGSFSRVLSQPAMHLPPKVTTEQTFVTVQPSPISVSQASASPPELQKGAMLSADQGAGLSMQSEVASQFTGAVSHGVGYDSKTGHAIGGTPQYMGTKFGDAVERASAAGEGDSIYNFSYGSAALIPVHSPMGSMGGSSQEGSQQGGSKSKFFDWKAYYNARLFSRILQKAPFSDHHAGIKKQKTLAFGKDGFGEISTSELQAFIKSLKLGTPISGYLNPFGRKPVEKVLLNSKQETKPQADEESFWEIYGEGQ